MQVKEVNGFQPEILARALNLVLQIVGRYAMHAANKFLGVEHTTVDVLALEIAARIGREIRVKGQIAGLGGNKHFVAPHIAGT